MRRRRFKEEQIAFALKQTETVTLVLEVCRKLAVRKFFSELQVEVFGPRSWGDLEQDGIGAEIGCASLAKSEPE